MRMTYNSDNGLTGVFEKGNFFGYEHYDLSVLKQILKNLFFMLHILNLLLMRN